MRGRFLIFAFTCILFYSMSLTGHGEEKPASAMDETWKEKWRICDNELADKTTPTPQQRVEACTFIISLGESGSPNKVVYFGAFWDRGYSYCAEGLWSEGLTDYDKAIRYSLEHHVFEPILTNVYAQRAECRIKAKQFYEAVQDIDMSFDTNPLKPFYMPKDEYKSSKRKWLRVLRGDAALGQGKYADAIEYYEEELSERPNTEGLTEKLMAARQLDAQKANAKGSSK